MKTRLPKAVWIGTLLLALTPRAASAYQIGENTPPNAGAARTGTSSRTSDTGPVRLARFSYVQGNVTWRAGDDAAWSPATVNLPIRQGAQISVTGGRAEVQFDDGSLLRLGSGAVVTLQTLYSDEDGEFTELDLSEGLLSVELRDSPSIYQINTPFVSVLSEGPSKVRVGAESSVEVAVRLGKATVEGKGAKTTLSQGGYLNVPAASSAFAIHLMPDPDSWDHFGDDRDRQLADPESKRRLPPDIARVAGNLSAYGVWHDDPHLGSVWCPRETDAGWRPYQHGHWVWVEPFGWTWVADESWGWAPYHYGTWVRASYGWAWVPGPAQQYWCPAVVGFSEYGDEVAWAPLAPSEVHYPVYLAHCYRNDDWADYFSIGGAAVYYPDDASSCDPRPFSTASVHGVVVVPTIPGLFRHPVAGTIVNRYIHPLSGIHPLPTGFIPTNARRYPGATVARKAEFGDSSHSRPQAANGGALWPRGRAARAPENGASPVSGPISVRPAARAAALPPPSLPGDFSGVPVWTRPVYRAPLPDRVARSAPPLPKAAAHAAPDADAVFAKPNAPPPFVPPVFASPVVIRPAASDETRQNAPEVWLPAQPAGVRRAEPGPIRIILPREPALPHDRRGSDAPQGDRSESQLERPAPPPEERPQEPQRSQEPQHTPPASDKQDNKQDNKSDDKKDDAGDQAERRGGRAR